MCLTRTRCLRWRELCGGASVVRHVVPAGCWILASFGQGLPVQDLGPGSEGHHEVALGLRDIPSPGGNWCLKYPGGYGSAVAISSAIQVGEKVRWIKGPERMICALSDRLGIEQNCLLFAHVPFLEAGTWDAMYAPRVLPGWGLDAGALKGHWLTGVSPRRLTWRSGGGACRFSENGGTFSPDIRP